MAKRIKTNYPGVFYREAKRIGRGGVEKVFYVVFKDKDGKVLEEKAGRQYKDKMSSQKASRTRSERIDGLRLSPKEIRSALKKDKIVWTVEDLFDEYKRRRPDLKSFGPDKSRFSKYLKPAFGKKQPPELAPLDVDRLRLQMQKSKKSPQTIRLTLALLRRLCNFGVEKRISNPVPFKIQLPRVYNIKTEDLTSEQIRKLFEAIEAMPHLMAGYLMKMALFTGMRRGELFKLKWEDIDFEKNFIKIRDPKGGPDQNIPLNDETRKVLDTVVRTKNVPYVFPGRGGGQRKYINKQANQIKEKAGLPKDFRPIHGLRHVYASMLASLGKVDMYTLQKLLTHKSPITTQRYAHLRDDVLKRASSLAGEMVGEVLRNKVNDERNENLEAQEG